MFLLSECPVFKTEITSETLDIIPKNLILDVNPVWYLNVIPQTFILLPRILTIFSDLDVIPLDVIPGELLDVIPAPEYACCYLILALTSSRWFLQKTAERGEQ